MQEPTFRTRAAAAALAGLLPWWRARAVLPASSVVVAGFVEKIGRMSAPLRVTGRRCWPLAAALLMLAGCKAAEEPALGTLEWDRITVPAPAMERIVAVRVHEGQRVSAGTSLLQLEPARTAAQLQSLQAQAERAQQSLQELRNGARPESIAQARANLAAARAQAASASAYYARLEPLGRRQLVAAADVDSARAAAGNAQGQMRAAEQALLVLEHGTRA